MPKATIPGGKLHRDESPIFKRASYIRAVRIDFFLHSSLSNSLHFNKMDTLQALPRDVDAVRNILFTLPLPFSLTSANYTLFWPLIDNVYSIRKSRDVPAGLSRSRGGAWVPEHKYHYVICRFKRPRDTASSLS